jgi:hypothetical protein
MFSGIWGVLGVARHAVALVILTGATTGLVAGSLDVNGTSRATATSTASTTPATVTASRNTNTGDLEALIKECLASKDPKSDACTQAIDKSGMAADAFWARLALSLNEQVHTKQEPKHEDKPATTPKNDDRKVDTRELIGLVAACVNTHERSSEPCSKALELSGLSAEEFWAKVSSLFNKPTTTAPKTDKTSEEVYTQLNACLAKFEAVRNGTYSEPITTSEACRKAFEATGLTPEQFYARFVQKAASAKPTEAPKTQRPVDEAVYALIKDCLAKYEAARTTNDGGTAASDACKKAIEASGLSSSDFWAKFGPKRETTKPVETPKPTAKPDTKPQGTQTASSAELAVMVKDCFAKYLAATAAKGNEELGRAAYEACTKAMAASGLSNDAFWAKFGTPQSPKI